MKNFLKLFGITALVVVIGFSMTACDDGSDSGGGSGALGDELTISNQQVYEQNYSGTSISYSNYNESKTFNNSSLYGGTGAITNGKFTFNLTTPVNTYLETFDANDLEEEGFINITVSNPEVKALIIEGFYTDGYYLSKENRTVNVSGKSASYTYERVIYVYVDSDVTVSGKGTTNTDQETEDGVTYKYTNTTKNFNLKLKAGWNAVRTNSTGTQSYTGTSPENATSYTSTYTTSLSLGDSSSCKWVLRSI